MKNLFGIVILAVLLLTSGAQGTLAQTVYDLGTYPGGTWAEPRDINNAGVVVGFGDISLGFTRPIGVPIFGRNAGQWFDLGTLGGDRTDGEVMCMGISDTGLIVGHAATVYGPVDNPDVHAFAWTQRSGMVDIGTLADLGYSDYNYSLAYMTNKAGTLIVGWSSTGWLGENSLPVVWTQNERTKKWKIQKLDTKGFESANYWYASGVNNSGQIIGTASDDSVGVEIAVLWNPVQGGKDWKIMKLPVSSDYPNAWPNDINEDGKIVGGLASPDWGIGIPALWSLKSDRKNTPHLTMLATISGELQWDEAMGINERGDIVGYGYDKDWNQLATRWSARDPNFVEALGFPGTWSIAFKVNTSGIAAGAYGSDIVPENTVVVRLR